MRILCFDGIAVAQTQSSTWWGCGSSFSPVLVGGSHVCITVARVYDGCTSLHNVLRGFGTACSCCVASRLPPCETSRGVSLWPGMDVDRARTDTTQCLIITSYEPCSCSWITCPQVDFVTEADRQERGSELAAHYAKSSLAVENEAVLQRWVGVTPLALFLPSVGWDRCLPHIARWPQRRSHQPHPHRYLSESEEMPEHIQKELNTRSSTVTPWWWGLKTLVKVRRLGI